MEEIKSNAPTPKEEQMNSMNTSGEDTSPSDGSSQKKSNNKTIVLVITVVIAVILVVGVAFKLVKRPAGTPRGFVPAAQVPGSGADDTSLKSLDTEIERAEKEESSLDDQLDELEELTF